MTQLQPDLQETEPSPQPAPAAKPKSSLSLSPKSLTLVAVIGLLLVQVLIVLFVLVPMYSNNSQTRSEIAAEESTQASLQQQINEAKAQNTQLAALQETLAQLQSEIPTQIDQEGFLRKVNDIVGSNAVSLGSINWKDAITFADFTKIVADYPVQPTSVTADQQKVYAQVNAALEAAVSDTQLQAVPVSITVTGTFDRMAGFISSAQHLDRIYWVNGINVSQDSSSDGATQFTAVLSGYTFIRPDAG
ncbi:type 4a pilus biogenesis protein PilO [Pseudoclavibacter soli]|uniref:type 4a pilus biogenesis protein PilO n=1 Tax=Pseudoclavibacter soli TaxID=452623 RepID=UPI00041B1397|nr:type 4a pilus biogenesis protein PilO [Pseudoclavibacter soli]